MKFHVFLMSRHSRSRFGWSPSYVLRITLQSSHSSHLESENILDLVSFVLCEQCCNLFRVFFERKYDYTPEEANTVNSIIYSIAAVASPICGYIVDRTGRNVMWVFISTAITIGAHALLAFSFVNPYVGTILMGMAYSMLASSLWPLVALIIPEYQLGTAYGICQSVQNLGLAVVSMFAGVIVDKGGFLMLELFFIGWLSGE